jgi:hypothetical protein
MTSDESYPEDEQEEPTGPWRPLSLYDDPALFSAIVAEPYKSAARNAQIAKGAALAEGADSYKELGVTKFGVRALVNGHYVEFLGDTLAEALIALAEAVDNA